jgi:hypothetical protein
VDHRRHGRLVALGVGPGVRAELDDDDWWHRLAPPDLADAPIGVAAVLGQHGHVVETGVVEPVPEAAEQLGAVGERVTEDQHRPRVDGLGRRPDRRVVLGREALTGLGRGRCAASGEAQRRERGDGDEGGAHGAPPSRAGPSA